LQNDSEVALYAPQQAVNPGYVLVSFRAQRLSSIIRVLLYCVFQ